MGAFTIIRPEGEGGVGANSGVSRSRKSLGSRRGPPARNGSGKQVKPEVCWGPGVSISLSLSPNSLSSCCHLPFAASIHEAEGEGCMVFNL